MKRGPQKYSKDLIRSAIQKSEDGASLTSIAKDMGLPKTTIKYWLDNPNKYLAETSTEQSNDEIARVQGKLLDYTWKYALQLCRRLKEKEADASFRDIVFGISQLVDVMSRVQISGGHAPVSTPVLQVSEETNITIRRFLEKKREMETPPGTDAPIDLAAEPPVSRPPTTEASESDRAHLSASTENRANG